MSVPEFRVYTHSANGKIFYVGSGAPKRPYNHHVRTPAWKEHVARVGKYETTIHVCTADRAEAYRVEAEMIKEHEPSCNLGPAPNYASPHLTIKIRPSAAAALVKAAKAHARPKSAIAETVIEQWLRAEGFLK